MTVMGVKTEVNLNTVAIVLSFLGTFAGIVVMWTTMQNDQKQFNKYIEEHARTHEVLDSRMEGLDKTHLANREAALDLSFRLGQIEKTAEGLDIRVSRVSESYNNQFSDIRAQLNAIQTSLALVNQTLNAMPKGVHAPEAAPRGVR